MNKDFVYTASGEGCEGTFGSYEEAYEVLIKSDSWGQILKHLPYNLDDENYPEDWLFLNI